MEGESTIYIMIGVADPPSHSMRNVSRGSKLVCVAQIKAKAGMYYPKLKKQAEKLKPGDRVILLQGGYMAYRGEFGAVRFVAAGTVKEAARQITLKDVVKNFSLWEATRKWYKDFPTARRLSGELIIKFDLKRAKIPKPKPKKLIITPQVRFKPVPSDHPVG
jgi:hypothetical protein